CSDPADVPDHGSEHGEIGFPGEMRERTWPACVYSHHLEVAISRFKLVQRLRPALERRVATLLGDLARVFEELDDVLLAVHIPRRSKRRRTGLSCHLDQAVVQHEIRGSLDGLSRMVRRLDEN